jgi:hypothetical protein
MARPKAGYRLASGKKVPGVTTITSRFGDKEALIGWAYAQGYAHGENGLPRNRFAAVEESADIGTFIHELIQWHLEGTNGEEPQPAPGLSPEAITRGRNGFDQFKRWLEQGRAHVESWEKPLVSEKYEFGGTPDGIFKYPGYNDVGDWKTSKRFYPETVVQVAGGYMLLIEENFPDWKMDGVQIVRFSKDAERFANERFGSGKLIEIAKKQFLLMREAWDNDQFIREQF